MLFQTDTEEARERHEAVEALMSCSWSSVMRMKAWVRLRLHRWRQRAAAQQAAAQDTARAG